MITFCCEAVHGISMLFHFFLESGAQYQWSVIIATNVGRSSVLAVTDSLSSRLINLLWIHWRMLYYFYVMFCIVIKCKKKDKKKDNVIILHTSWTLVLLVLLVTLVLQVTAHIESNVSTHWIESNLQAGLN